MAEGTATKATYKSLAESVKAAPTITELFKLGNSQEFKDAALRLPPAELEALREDYKAAQIQLDGKVKLEAFDGQIINIVDVQWWHSDTFDKGATGGDGVTLFFRAERDAAKRYKASTSSAAIVRFCNRFANTLPTEAAPARVEIKLTPVNDAERARQGHKRWQIKQLPTPQQSSATPF